MKIMGNKIMKNKQSFKLFIFLIVYLTTGFSSLCFAGDPVFQNTQDEMVKELTRQPVKYRGFVPDAKKRSIMVIEKKSTQAKQGSITVVSNSDINSVPGNTPNSIGNLYETKTIVVVDNQDVPKLKLKIEFDYNSSALRSSSFILLRELALALTSSELKNSEFLVAGHTDSDGTNEYNLKLSLDRANSVKEYLVLNFNIPEPRLKIRGYGESMPLKPNTDSFYKQVNRRVEIELVQ